MITLEYQFKSDAERDFLASYIFNQALGMKEVAKEAVLPGEREKLENKAQALRRLAVAIDNT